MLELSVITAIKPQRISKGFCLEDGNLISMKGGELISGELETLRLSSMNDLAATLRNLDSKQAITWGICGHDKIHIATNGRAEKLKSAKVISRTRKNFSWPEKHAVLMLDYDSYKDEDMLSATELLDIVYEICPAIRTAPHLVKASASSHIYLNGEQLRGDTGWRILVAVKNRASRVAIPKHQILIVPAGSPIC
jgi:hypothetical protein